MSPGPGSGADEILSSAGRSQASRRDRAPSPAEVTAREEMQTKAQPSGRKADLAPGQGPEHGVHTHPQRLGRGRWHLNISDFKSIFSSPEPKPHPHGPWREAGSTSVWQKGSGQGRCCLTLTPSLPSTLGTKPPQIPHSNPHRDFAYVGAASSGSASAFPNLPSPPSPSSSAAQQSPTRPCVGKG